MQSTQSLKQYTNASFEIPIAVLTIAPVIVLSALYEQLSSQTPVLLMKYGAVKSRRQVKEATADYQERVTKPKRHCQLPMAICRLVLAAPIVFVIWRSILRSERFV